MWCIIEAESEEIFFFSERSKIFGSCVSAERVIMDFKKVYLVKKFLKIYSKIKMIFGAY